MSEGTQKQDAAIRARDIEACASAWLERRTFGDWEHKDQEAFERWLAESLAHEVAFLRLHAAWTYADRLAVLRHPMRLPRPFVTEKRDGPSRLLAVAAFVVAIIAAGSAYVLSPVSEQTYSTGLGGHKIISLADGSQIELNTDTILRAKIDARQRKLWLVRGEAYFQVKHDAAHPFVVMMGPHRVTDLGTRFLIRRDKDRLEVALLEGHALFDTSDNNMKPASLDLRPGDHVTVDHGNVVLAKLSPEAQKNDLAWRRGLLVFDRTALADAAAEFNRYNREKIVIRDPAVAHMPIGGTFRADNINSFVGVAQDVLGLHVAIRDGVMTISR